MYFDIEVILYWDSWYKMLLWKSVSDPWNYQIFLKLCLHGECLLYIKFGFIETLVLYRNTLQSAQKTTTPRISVLPISTANWRTDIGSPFG